MKFDNFAKNHKKVAVVTDSHFKLCFRKNLILSTLFQHDFVNLFPIICFKLIQ